MTSVKRPGKVIGCLREIHILLKVLQKQKIDGINFKRTDFSFHFPFNPKTGAQILFDAAILGLLIWLR